MSRLSCFRERAALIDDLPFKGGDEVTQAPDKSANKGPEKGVGQ